MPLGDTWRNRVGSRIGLFQRTVDGRQEPVRPRIAVWSSDGSPVLAPELGESEWTITGKINTAEPSNTPKWAILVAKTAFKKAAAEAISQRSYFMTRYDKAEDFYNGMWEQDHSIPGILAHAKGQIGHSAPNASRWLTERARRYAVKYEGYETPKASKAQTRGDVDTSTNSDPLPAASTLSTTDKIKTALSFFTPSSDQAKQFGIAAAVFGVAVVAPILWSLGKNQQARNRGEIV